MASALRYVITNLSGAPLTPPRTPALLAGPTATRQQTQATKPLSDARTGQVNVSMYDPASALLTAGNSVVKLIYRSPKGTSVLLINGIVLQPSANFDDGTVSATLHDSSVRLKNRFLRYGDNSVSASINGGYGIPLDGTGLRTIIADCEPPFGESIYPGTGIASGLDTVPHQPALVGGVPLSGSLYVSVARGDCAWDDILDMAQAAGGFDFDLVPIDAQHLGPSGTAPTTHILCELHTAVRLGVDRSQSNQLGNTPVVFVHGRGGFHLTYEPDAGSMRNYAVQIGPGGPADPNDVLNKGLAQDATSWHEYGIWEDWEQATMAGDGDTTISNAILVNRAKAVVTAYATPPQFMSAVVDTDSVGGLCWPDDFDVGDTVTVYARRGYMTVGPIDARITSVGVQQKDADGNCQLVMSLVPHLTADSGLTVPTD